MGDWSLWKLRPPALAYVLVVQLAAVVVMAVVIATALPPSVRALRLFAVIALMAGVVIVATSVSIHLRHETRRNPWTIHIAYLAAGILTLPPNMLVLLLLGPALHGVLDTRPELYRWMFTTAATTLAVFAARGVIGWHHPHWSPVLLVLCATVLLLVRAVVIAVGLRLRSPQASRQGVLGEPIDVLLGIVAASLGGLLAMAVDAYPAAALLAAPPLALLDLAGQLPQWRRSAQSDGKTGLANAVHWEQRARVELTRISNRGHPAAVLLLDLDHFKRVNDEIGHLAGDAVLAAVALMLRGSVRKEDVVGRFGGEEFVVLLPGADDELARTVAQRVRLATASLSVPTRDTHGHPCELDNVTVSIGVATSVRFGYELPDLLVAADAALLAAKAGGRNAVTMA